MILNAFLILALVATNLVWVRYLRARDEDERKERDKLLTRIQAPEIASLPEIEEPEPVIPAALDDDPAFWDSFKPVD